MKDKKDFFFAALECEKIEIMSIFLRSLNENENIYARNFLYRRFFGAFCGMFKLLGLRM